MSAYVSRLIASGSCEASPKEIVSRTMNSVHRTIEYVGPPDDRVRRREPRIQRVLGEEREDEREEHPVAVRQPPDEEGEDRQRQQQQLPGGHRCARPQVPRTQRIPRDVDEHRQRDDGRGDQADLRLQQDHVEGGLGDDLHGTGDL
jgi:hypothetical protein